MWQNFAALSAIPRPSKQEERVMAWLKDWAGQRGLQWQQDAIGVCLEYGEALHQVPYLLHLPILTFLCSLHRQHCNSAPGQWRR